MDQFAVLPDAALLDLLSVLAAAARAHNVLDLADRAMAFHIG